MNILHEVYVNIDSQNLIIDIRSDWEMFDKNNYIKIDKGIGQQFAHAQNYYFPKDKPLKDNTGYNYKYENGQVVALTEEEKKVLFPRPKEKPTSTDVIIAKLMKLNAEQQAINSELMKQIAELKGGK